MQHRLGLRLAMGACGEQRAQCSSMAVFLRAAGFKMEQDSGRFKATFEYQAPCFLKYVVVLDSKQPNNWFLTSTASFPVALRSQLPLLLPADVRAHGVNTAVACHVGQVVSAAPAL